jgi:hypothetical protein
MNERIKELVEQAGFTVARGIGLKDTVPEDVFIANVCVSNEMEKFAELIVRECKTALYKQYSNGEFMYLEGCYKAISDHFGISGVKE